MKRNKKRIAQDCLIIVLAVLLLLCIGLLGYRFYQYKQGDSIYEKAIQLADFPNFSEIDIGTDGDNILNFSSHASSAESQESKTDSPGTSGTLDTPGSIGISSAQELTIALNPYVESLQNIKLQALREVNPDVIGWIVVPGTRISYPMVQANDNDYYLHRTWNLTDSIVGSIFMDANCTPDLGDFNTLIYGHNMAIGSMFGELRQFKTTAYRNYHPVFLITTDTGVYTYRIFSAFEASVTDPVFMIQVGRNDEKQSLIDCAVEKSVIATGIIPSIEDHIVTLSTCTGRGYATRWVVVGRLESFLESVDVNG